jgi:predicted metal-dependent phosphotriesterase family hydrolase
MEVLNTRNPLGILFNLHNTIPYLRTIGVTDQQIRRITTENPELFFARTG